MSAYMKPLPDVDVANSEFWRAAREQGFLLYRCSRCDSYYYPATDCTVCEDIEPEMRWVEASGRGTLYTWIVMHRKYHDGFEDDVPYNVALVHLEEGPFFLTNVVGCSNEDLYAGMDLEVAFEKATDDVTLPKFKPAVKG
jgi:uncharacterized OB-fold protein